jgi:hypothetical protein
MIINGFKGFYMIINGFYMIINGFYMIIIYNFLMNFI